jgi:hypothetical protein
MSSRRWPALLALLLVLGALAGASIRRDTPARSPFGRALGPAMPVAAPLDGRASTWFCAAGAARADSPINLSLAVVNAGSEPRAAQVTWYPETGAAITRSVALPPADVVILTATDVLSSPTVSAVVEVDGGGVAVEHAVSGSGGTAYAPCASESSSRWYLPVGITERDGREVLALFNPFPADAVVDLRFSTESGRVDPPAAQGLPIPARTTAYVEVGNLVRRRAVAAVEIVARTGELVVDRVQLFDGSEGRRGVGLTTGAARGAQRWEFPDGLVQPSIGESWYVYNPSDDDAEITLLVDPVSGDPPPPLDLTVPAHSQHTITSADVVELAAGVAHTSTIESRNGVPIVAERVVDLRAPSPRVGWSSMFGAPASATRWLFALGAASSEFDEWLVVRNPGTSAAMVSVVALTTSSARCCRCWSRPPARSSSSEISTA